MKRLKKSPLLIAGIPLAFIQLAGILTATLWVYTTLNLEIAKREGVYANPEAGMRVHIAESWVGIERVEITYAGPTPSTGAIHTSGL
jgi:hypothetical protein